MSGAQRAITPAELAEHGGSHAEPWTAYGGVVYDLSGFVERHPGGPVVLLAAGRDGTQLIDSYHSADCVRPMRAALKRLRTVGRCAAPAEAPPFYAEVQRRVAAELAAKRISRRHLWWVSLVEYAVLLALYVSASYMRVVHQSLLGAVLAGIATARLGFLMHMSNHEATSAWGFANRLLSSSMEVVGMSSYVWRFEHQVAHHLYPNVYGIDNDCSIGDPLLRFSDDVPATSGHRFQNVTTFVLMTFGLWKWLVIDFVYMYNGRAGSVSFQPTRRDWAYLCATKALWVTLQILVPVYLHGVWAGLLGVTIMFAVGAHYMENIFIVNHIQDNLVPPHGTHWSECQVYGSANWCSGGRVANVVSGGLNHQIEHHLFPSFSIYALPHISKVVRDTCREYGLPYNNFASFPEAWLSCWTHLAKLGSAGPSKSK